MVHLIAWPLLALSSAALAGEGMWRPSDLAREDLPLPEDVARSQVLGMANLDGGPLASVVELNGCSGAFVSDEGLVVTAYHCVWDALRSVSAEGENLIDSGFEAATREEERPVPAFTVRRTVAMTDVSADVLAGTEDLEAAERTARIERNSAKLVRRCEAGGNRCELERFDGTEWVLIEREVLSDVRLVLTPPRDLGYFGSHADNWRWPRHSADFAFLRVYADKRNRSREHDAKNVPYRPPSHLEMGTGPEPGTFVAVAGFPAQTWRHMSAPQLEHVASEQLPRQLALTEEVIDIYERVASRHPELEGWLQPPRLNLQNRQLYLQGGITSLARARALELRWHRDRSLARWVMGSAERTGKWGAVVEDLRELSAESARSTQQDLLYDELRRVSLLGAAMRVERWARESQEPAEQRERGYREADGPELVAWLDDLKVRYLVTIDRPLLKHLLMRALQLPEEEQIPELKAWLDALPAEGSVEERVDKAIYEFFTRDDLLLDAKTRAKLLAMTPKELRAEGGGLFALSAALVDYAERRNEEREQLDLRWSVVQPRYLEALREFVRTRYTAEPYYSEANGTLRVTFGHVEGFEPEDGLVAKPRTTLAGLRRKANAPPYAAPEPFLQASEGGPNSVFADPELGDVSVNFLSTADTTGGSSGSPTFTLDGRWVGLVFDGNYEGMATDWTFDAERTRSIHTDASYVLWYLNEVAEAKGLLAEMGVDGGD